MPAAAVAVRSLATAAVLDAAADAAISWCYSVRAGAAVRATCAVVAYVYFFDVSKGVYIQDGALLVY